MKRFAAFILAAAFMTAAASAMAVTPKEAWDKLEGKLSKAKDVKAVIDFFTYYPDSLRKYYPDADEELKHNVGGWRYQKLDYSWRKPATIYVKFLRARNIGNDIAFTIVQENPGTIIVFGYRDHENIHVRFPVTKKTKAVFPKVAETYFSMPADNAKFSSAITGMSYSTTPAELVLGGRGRYFREGAVTMEEGRLVRKENFKMKKKRMKYDRVEAPGDYYIITMTPKDVEKNRGVTREVMVLDKKSFLPALIEMYHGDTLAVCFSITDIEVDVGLKDELWEGFYEGVELMEAVGSHAE